MRIAALTLLWLAACGTTPQEPAPGDPDFVRDPALDVALTSEAGGVDSHEAGASCQHCHQARGPGPGRFTVAGTLYGEDGAPAAAGAIQVLSVRDGTELLRLPVDALGNFYTTVDLGLPDSAILPVVLDADGAVVHSMPFPTSSGACNHCHTPARRVSLDHDHGVALDTAPAGG